LDLRKVFVLVHVILDIGLLDSHSFGPLEFPSEVPWFVTVVALPYWGSCALGVLPYLSCVSLTVLFVLLGLSYVGPSWALVVSQPPLVGWGASPREVHWNRDII